MELRMKADGLSPLGSTKRPPWAKVAREDVLLGLAGIREISSIQLRLGRACCMELEARYCGVLL